MTDEKIKPVVWVDDDLDIHFGATHPEMTGNNWKPHYPESALTQAREEGKREGMLLMREAVEDNWINCPRSADDSTLSAFEEFMGRVNEAITRAAEGK